MREGKAGQGRAGQPGRPRGSLEAPERAEEESGSLSPRRGQGQHLWAAQPGEGSQPSLGTAEPLTGCSGTAESSHMSPRNGSDPGNRKWGTVPAPSPRLPAEGRPHIKIPHQQTPPAPPAPLPPWGGCAPSPALGRRLAAHGHGSGQLLSPDTEGHSPQPQRGETRLTAAQRNPILLRPGAASPAANEVPLISSLIASS